MRDDLPASAFVIPDGEEPNTWCPYCDRPFRIERLYHLHLGEAHFDHCDETQLEAYDQAFEDESAELFVFHLWVIGSIAGLLVAFIYVYGFALG